MRRALILLVAAGLGLGGTLVSASGAEPSRHARAQAALTGGDVDARGSVSAESNDDERKRTGVRVPGVRIARGETIARAGPGPAGYATAFARDVEILDGKVVAYAVRRTEVLGERGRRAWGRVSGLRVDGRFLGDVERPRVIAFDGGRVLVNQGTTGLRVVLDAEVAPLSDIRVAVARVARVEAPEPTATATATPTPARTADPTPTPTATAAATATPSERRRARERREAARVRTRLTRRGYAFPVVGQASAADTFGAARAAPVVKHEGTDIFAPFGSPVVAVRAGRLSRVGTLPISGNRLWLTTEDGDAFFYAHMSTFATAAKDGTQVKAGEVLGYLGNTGDAEPTPPHVHFEIHPGGESKAAIDPYPVVAVWQDRSDAPSSTERSGALVTVRDFIADD